MSDPFDLSDRVAVVTGGAQGLGAAIAGSLANLGAHVAMLDLRADAVEQVAAELRQSSGRETLALPCDTRDSTQVDDCIAQIAAKFGRIDILVNNAGIHRRGSPTDYKPEDLAEVFAVNLVGCYHMVAAVGKVMVRAQRGSIINVSALGGGVLGLGRGGSIYGMTKGGIVSLTRDLAAEWGRYNIRVNAVAPGWIRTPMTNALQNDPVRSAKVLERVPLRRWGEAADVAGVVAFLASDAAAYVSGVTIPIDGGAANTIMLMME